ncbi:DUF5330 domain-containing protein [Aureimonas frigidaquae]|uniref:DUF5330 domain-containing protein n=1 Tax=Aureimonas frigidaquae TaxID=424757 RepID=UPI000783D977|nr:DUF5330 domain-containing protein [Aureimonas frigidaquae]
MVRFILRAAFLLGLIAFFLPGGRNEDGPSLNYFQAFAGLQEAMSDLGGFCDRAPTACNSAGQVAGFVANRIGDGLEFGYQALTGARGAPQLPAGPPATVDPTPGAPSAGHAPAPASAAAMPIGVPYIPLAERHTAATTAGSGAAVPAPSPRPPSTQALPPSSPH